jgi:hypothetical protein
MKGMVGRGRMIPVVVLAAAIAFSCGARDWRRALLRAGAVNVAEEIEKALDDSVSVMDASFSPDSHSVLVHVLSLTNSKSSLWVYRIKDGSLVENGLRSGWTLSAAAFLADSRNVILAAERPEPPTYRIYQARVGSTEWANLTDLIPTTHVKTTAIAPSPDGETFAVVSIGEGHPDIVVSRGGEILHETQVYPGYVRIVGWGAKGSVLYLESDMPLDLGLTMEAREKNIAWDETMREGIKERVYGLDVGSGQVVVAQSDAIPDPTVSPDGRWKLHVIPVGEGMKGLFLTSR